MKVISYNIDRNGSDPQARYKRLATQIYSYDPDIVFLHEVLEQYIGEFRHSEYNIRLGSPTVVYKSQYGSMIAYISYGVTVRTPSYTIASIHAKSGLEFDHIRQSQAYTMFNHCVRWKLPIVLVGDVNTEGDFGFFTDPRYFRELYVGSTWFSNRSNLAINRTYSKRYDRAFCSIGFPHIKISKLCNEPVNGIYSSDHDGIAIHIGNS